MKKKQIRKGDVWWVDFEPAKGGEIKKSRPAVVVSNNLANRSLNRCQVIPLSRNVSDVRASEVKVLFNGMPQKACIDQIRTVSKLRIDNKQGKLSAEDFERLRQQMKIYFELQDGKK